MIRSSRFRCYGKGDQHPAKGIVLMMSEFGGGFASVGKHHGQAALSGNAHFDRMITIDQCRRHADGGRDPVGGKQQANQQQQMHQPG
ncbi:MAG: hypothetical protein K9N47_21315 [Prosthecobacter sp.]|uniref:hypothetical protein n=1 Tax=Prosthecobacter sp. TaxID=1965333 RepID=UPI0026085056|nr:hypothetical protein [Prosthecobacter sp.]MCF7788677.1 hypothetical protein [Prosthecobacter sp.]